MKNKIIFPVFFFFLAKKKWERKKKKKRKTKTKLKCWQIFLIECIKIAKILKYSVKKFPVNNNDHEISHFQPESCICLEEKTLSFHKNFKILSVFPSFVTLKNKEKKPKNPNVNNTGIKFYTWQVFCLKHTGSWDIWKATYVVGCRHFHFSEG